MNTPRDMLTLRDNALSAFQNISRNVSGTLCIAASSMPSQLRATSDDEALFAASTRMSPSMSSNATAAEVVRSIVNRKAEIGMTGAVIESAKCVFEGF